ncbi:MAG: DUF2203 domain-containing protein [Pyrinomonadaceae bacterium]|jgi:hypothetical protein|nr:DUF2203 domain-containing protein [Blastocatellia bacterium]MCW5955269.1 DUF2203 domain-containing protein [Pyrinomonadaceae bacterium]
MKIFTLEEANELIPEMRRRLQRLQQLYSAIGEMRESAKAAASSSEFGGGMKGGSGYVRSLYEVGKITTEIHDAGVQLKDYERGLIDFPTMRGGRMVLLCWQLDEGDQIEWWHDTEAGFAGRQRL